MPVDPRILQYFQDKFDEEEEKTEPGFDGQMVVAGVGDVASSYGKNLMRISGVGVPEGQSAQDDILKQRQNQQKQLDQRADRKLDAAKSLYEIGRRADEQQAEQDYRDESLRLQRERIRAHLDKKNQPKPPTVGQAKQQGLAEMGEMANKQYEDAVEAGKTRGTNDPTDAGEFIDNSNWAPNIFKSKEAVERQNAERAWVEAYLRDASGAAIAKHERTNYADDYFPRPGDSPQAIENKRQLRLQKEKNARFAAGAPDEPIPGQTSTQDNLDGMSDAELEAEARRLGIK